VAETGAALGDDDSNPTPIAGKAGAGVVNILPTGGNCVSGVTQFLATGYSDIFEGPNS
jgi:hypothetical protein